MKKLLAVVVPLVLAVTCSIAVWANEPGAAQPCPNTPGCPNCVKAPQAAAQQAPKEAGCEKCAKMKGAEAKPCGEGCDKAKMAAKGCENCPKMKGAEVKPCGEGCDKAMKAAKGCDNCPKMKGTDAKPCAGCDKQAKMQQVESVPPCCDKNKKQ